MGNEELLAQIEEEDTDMIMKTEPVPGRCSIDNLYQNTGLPQLERPESNDKASAPLIGEQDYIKQTKELHSYLDMLKSMVRPGCSQEMLKVALNSMSSLFNALIFMLSTPKPRASL